MKEYKTAQYKKLQKKAYPNDDYRMQEQEELNNLLDESNINEYDSNEMSDMGNISSLQKYIKDKHYILSQENPNISIEEVVNIAYLEKGEYFTKLLDAREWQVKGWMSDMLESSIRNSQKYKENWNKDHLGKPMELSSKERKYVANLYNQLMNEPDPREGQRGYVEDHRDKIERIENTIAKQLNIPIFEVSKIIDKEKGYGDYDNSFNDISGSL